MKRLNKKGQVINGLTVAISAIAGLAILLAISLLVLGSLADTQSVGDCSYYWNTTMQACTKSSSNTTVMSGNSASYNSTTSIVEKLATAPTWIGILIVVIFASAVLYFWKVNNS